MSYEGKILLSILKLTRDDELKAITNKDLNRDSGIPLQLINKCLNNNYKNELIEFDGQSFTVERKQRLKIMIKAIKLGVDIEKACVSLTWTEFEDIALLAFDLNGFKTKKHFRFSLLGRKWEIDILGLKKPIVACIDCKHWHRGWRGKASIKAATLQVERTKVLTKLPNLKEKIKINTWKHVYFVPIILSLMPGKNKFYQKIPIVPIFQLRDFIQDIPSHLNTLNYIRKNF